MHKPVKQAAIGAACRAERNIANLPASEIYLDMSPSQYPADRLEVAYITLERTGGITATARVATVQQANFVLEQWSKTLRAPERAVCHIGFHFEDGFECRARYKIGGEQKRVSIARDLRKGIAFEALSYARSGNRRVFEAEDGKRISDGAVWSIRTLLERYSL
ncbi:hypothetical protein [Noviherbaspirillum aerium]|uniref:hypothetical protein n=1 Tax=Noviherbaspirillum aerium TaxID=2588497 RepID=UPI00124ED13D|nr:hypothetical protein [Noviherbaspirillum aerium]